MFDSAVNSVYSQVPSPGIHGVLNVNMSIHKRDNGDHSFVNDDGALVRIKLKDE